MKRGETWSGYGLTIGFSKNWCGRVQRFISELELAGLFESSDYDSTNLVSPFSGAISNTFRGEFENAKGAKAFTDFVDLLQFIYRYKLSPSSTESELSELY